jgi:hypothetical protein
MRKSRVLPSLVLAALGSLLLACGGKAPVETGERGQPATAPGSSISPASPGAPAEPTSGATRKGEAPAGGTAEETSAPALASRPRFGFADITAAAGLAGFRHATGASGKKWFPETMGSGAAFLDYDGDGWLDVLLVAGGALEPGEPGGPALALYRNTGNEGNGRFVPRTREAHLEGVRAYGFGAWVADYDGDGDPDILLTTLAGNLLFRNDGGTFAEVGAEAGVRGGPSWNTAAVFFDADRDGRLDLWVGSYVAWSPQGDLLCSLDGTTKSYCTPELYTGAPGHFYHNEGDGRFAEQTERRGLGGGRGKTLGAVAFDYDGDGWPDLFVANDTEANLLYRNRGDGTFAEVGAASGVALDESGRARAGMGVDAGVVDGEDGGSRPSLFVGNFSKESIGVYRYAGDDLFLNRESASGIGRQSLLTLTFGLFLADLDLDGDLDLFAADGHVREEVERAQEGIFYREAPHLFLNDGRGVFADAAERLGGPLAARLLARGAAYGDVDGDGDLDLLVTENGGPAHLWRNGAAGGPGARSLRVRLDAAGGNRDGIGARLTVEAGGRRMEREVRAGASYLASSEPTATFGLGPAPRAERLRVRWPDGRTTEIRDLPADREYRLVESAAPAGRERAGRRP